MEIIKIKNNSNKIYDFLVLILIFISGNPLFKNNLILLFVLAYTFLFFSIKNKKYTKNFLSLILFLSFIVIFQSIKFENIYFITSFGVFSRIMIGYFIVRLVGKRFIERYIKIMFYIASYSLVLYLLTNLNSEIFSIFSINASGLESEYPRMCFLGFFTFIEQSLYRNCGPFWEPGAFGGYLLIAFMFNDLSNSKHKKYISIILVISILTTLSTTAYVTICFFTIMRNYKKINVISNRLFMTLFVFTVSILIYFNFEFLNYKVSSQFNKAKIWQETRTGRTDARFINLLRDVEELKGHVITGRGANPKTRYINDSRYEQERVISTVGFSDIILKFGFPFSIFIYYLLYTSIRNYLYYNSDYGNYYSVIIFISFILILSSQVYFNYPLFWGLLFLKHNNESLRYVEKID